MKRDEEMQEVFFTIMVFGALMCLMAVGVIFGRRPLKGSCGGVAGDGSCPCADSGTPNACAIETDEIVEVSGLTFYEPPQH